MHSPVSTASASFVFQCFAIFSARGSSGLGALKRAWMLPREYMSIHFPTKMETKSQLALANPNLQALNMQLSTQQPSNANMGLSAAPYSGYKHIVKCGPPGGPQGPTTALKTTIVAINGKPWNQHDPNTNLRRTVRI